MLSQMILKVERELIASLVKKRKNPVKFCWLLVSEPQKLEAYLAFA